MLCLKSFEAVQTEVVPLSHQWAHYTLSGVGQPTQRSVYLSFNPAVREMDNLTDKPDKKVSIMYVEKKSSFNVIQIHDNDSEMTAFVLFLPYS